MEAGQLVVDNVPLFEAAVHLVEVVVLVPMVLAVQVKVVAL